MRRSGLAVTLSLFLPAIAGAQAPWRVTVTPTMSPLPIGYCAAVDLTVLDARGQRPRNPAGYLMGLADFDMSVTSPATGVLAVVGLQIDPSLWKVCGCQAGVAGVAGAVATITASYPAARLPAKHRAPGVAFQTTTTVTLAAAKGRVEPPGCGGPPPVTIAVEPATPLQKTPPAAAAVRDKTPPAATAVKGGHSGAPPTGVAVTGTPLTAKVTWTAAPNAIRYAVLRKDDAKLSVERSPAGFTATEFTETLPDPRITYRYTVVAHYANGTSGEAPAVQYMHPPMLNPTGFTATKKGQTTTHAVVEFAWNAVPGAVRYRLHGPGIANTGHYLTTTTISWPKVPRGAGTWTVGALYPGNYGDYANPASVSAVFRILPTPSVPWLTKSNGPGSQDNVQMPSRPTLFSQSPPNELRHPYGENYAEWLATSMNDSFGLKVWLSPFPPYPHPALWDDPVQYPVEAWYGNPGDLGVGRRSDCVQWVRGPPRPGTYTVCYAAAHGIPPGQPGFNDPQVITRPGEGQGDDFLLAMVITKDPQGSVFMVFGKGGKYKLSPTVTLDTQGEKFVPHACLSCHGGTYNPVTRYVDGASLLPIDPNLQSWASEEDKAGQQERIRRINAMIAESGSSPAIRAYIYGLYGGATLPNQEATVDYVPAGWQAQAGLYRHVVRPYCAMCHLAAQSDLSFASWGNFLPRRCF